LILGWSAHNAFRAPGVTLILARYRTVECSGHNGRFLDVFTHRFLVQYICIHRQVVNRSCSRLRSACDCGLISHIRYRLEHSAPWCWSAASPRVSVARFEHGRTVPLRFIIHKRCGPSLALLSVACQLFLSFALHINAALRLSCFVAILLLSKPSFWFLIWSRPSR